MSNLTQNFWQTFEPIKVIGKQRGYFTLAWTKDVLANWLGASEVMIQYNYTASGNFTMDELPDMSGIAGMDIVACIRYQVDGVVTRYKLNDSPSGDSVYFPMYNGEVILKNFTIELWSGSVFTYGILRANFAPVQFDVSILKAKQTLTDEDTFEDCVEAECANLASQNGLLLALQYNGCPAGVSN